MGSIIFLECSNGDFSGRFNVGGGMLGWETEPVCCATCKKVYVLMEDLTGAGRSLTPPDRSARGEFDREFDGDDGFDEDEDDDDGFLEELHLVIHSRQCPDCGAQTEPVLKPTRQLIPDAHGLLWNPCPICPTGKLSQSTVGFWD